MKLNPEIGLYYTGKILKKPAVFPKALKIKLNITSEIILGI